LLKKPPGEQDMESVFMNPVSAHLMHIGTCGMPRSDVQKRTIRVTKHGMHMAGVGPIAVSGMYAHMAAIMCPGYYP
jgi:hypothetical protein